MTITGNLIDIHQRRTYPATVEISNGIINSIREVDTIFENYILPGFVDAHIHIESSMLTPVAFAQMAVTHGTVATVSDPHEIANVCGKEGVHYMIENAKQTNFKFFFGVPSCVPATGFETAGATLDSAAVGELLSSPDLWYLSEMMNYPGVLYKDPEVMAKINAAKRVNKPVDGHAPGLRGAEAAQYAAAGISTDHECFTLEEALDKIAAGMYIIIREGSAAKNFEALHSLLTSHPDRVMLCSDDKHPDELALHHINQTVKRALAKGHDLYNVLRAASLNAVRHYKLPVGLLQEGDPADFIIIDSLQNINILHTFINGNEVAQNGKSHLRFTPPPVINNFAAKHKSPADFSIATDRPGATIRVIEAIEGQLVTNCLELPARIENGKIVSDTARDILKIAIINRYHPNAPVAKGFIKNIGIKSGALASTVAHDCHNIIAVGVDDETICAAVNALIDCKGGIAVARSATDVSTLPLPIAGLMSDKDGHTVADAYTAIDKEAKQLGTTLHAPFMTMSFMALLVIPSLKLSDLGLFDGNKFAFTDLAY
jgi:adenine deaminase